MWEICAVGSQKNMHVIRVFSAGIFARSPSAPLGISKKPLWASGDLGEDPLEKTRITYIYL